MSLARNKKSDAAEKLHINSQVTIGECKICYSETLQVLKLFVLGAGPHSNSGHIVA